jgi:hypothetical protein
MRTLKTAICWAALACMTSTASAQITGPTSSASPYIVSTADDWFVASLLTVGDSPRNNDSYQMIGIPDGLGALGGRFDPDSGRYVAEPAFITVFMNHELAATAGAVHAHGQPGAFVSQWTLHLNSLAVMSGEDLIRDVYTWNGTAYVRSTDTSARFGRFCSADLPAWTAFYNPGSGRGFSDGIFMNGEEVGAEGRAFAHVVSGSSKGQSYELPALGRFSWENSLAHADAGDNTVVVGLDDSTPGQVYVYVGTKQYLGNPVERAGLTGGNLYGIKVTDATGAYPAGVVPLENNGPINGNFELVDVSDARASGAVLQAESVARGITQFARPEDGHWDTKDPRVFYFVTTGATVGTPQTSRLYKLTFDSIANPIGGTIELVVDSADLVGDDGDTARSFDNITVSGDGHVIVQEDPGANAYIAKIWDVDPNNALDALQIFESDRTRFLSGSGAFLTIDEENSGVIEITSLVGSASWFDKGRRYYLGVTQAHYPNGAVLVEGGQFYIIASADTQREDADDDKQDAEDQNHDK